MEFKTKEESALIIRALRTKVIRYFLQGILFAVPITVTIIVIYRVILFVDNILPVHYPGLGIFFIVSGLTLLGALGSSFVFRPIINYFESLIERAPLIKVIYSSVKELLSAFVGKEKKFNQPVLVKLSEVDNLYRIGFITQSNLTKLGITEDMVAVYLPHSYNFSGDLFVIPRKCISPFKGSASEIMKFVVSGGITDVDDIELIS